MTAKPHMEATVEKGEDLSVRIVAAHAVTYHREGIRPVNLRSSRRDFLLRELLHGILELRTPEVRYNDAVSVRAVGATDGIFTYLCLLLS